MIVANSLLQHQFQPADAAWLSAVALSEAFDPRIAKVELRDKLPPDFDPRRIDPRFYRDDNLTLIGYRRFRPDAPILAQVEAVALEVQRKLLATPGIDSVSAIDLMAATGLDEVSVTSAVTALSDLLPFFAGMTNDFTGRLTEVWFTGPRGYDEPLRFTTLDEALERVYREQGQLREIFGSLPSNLFGHSAADFAPVNAAGALPSSQIKKNTAFVIMPIDPERPELADVLDAIKEVAARFGIKAYRADEIEHQDRITNIILEEIKTCEYLIADLSHERPNVYYEVGFAHALEKRPILFRRQGTRLHFDLSVHNVPEYRNARELRELLNRRFEAILGRSAP